MNTVSCAQTTKNHKNSLVINFVIINIMITSTTTYKSEELSFEDELNALDNEALGEKYKFFTRSQRDHIRVTMIVLGVYITIEQMLVFEQYKRVAFLGLDKVAGSILVGIVFFAFRFTVIAILFKGLNLIEKANANQETSEMMENDPIKTWLVNFVERQGSMRFRFAILLMSWFLIVTEIWVLGIKVCKDDLCITVVLFGVIFYIYAIFLMFMTIVGALVMIPDAIGSSCGTAELYSLRQRNDLCKQGYLISISKPSLSTSV